MVYKLCAEDKRKFSSLFSSCQSFFNNTLGTKTRSWLYISSHSNVMLIFFLLQTHLLVICFDFILHVPLHLTNVTLVGF